MEERGSSKLILRRYLGCKAHFSQVSNYVRGSLSRCSTKRLVARELFFSVPRCKMATIGLGSSHNCFCAGDLMFALGPCWFVWLSRNNLSGFGFSVVAYDNLYHWTKKWICTKSQKNLGKVGKSHICLFFYTPVAFTIFAPYLLLNFLHFWDLFNLQGDGGRFLFSLKS